jgi:hypothetical protein
MPRHGVFPRFVHSDQYLFPQVPTSSSYMALMDAEAEKKDNEGLKPWTL